MKAFPRQRIPYSQKNKSWRMDCVDFLCAVAESADDADYERMQENYNFHNNVIAQNDYQEYIDPLGLDAGKGRDFIHAFNKAHNKIQILKGEELKRPWEYSVTDLSPSASNEILRAKKREVKEYLDFQIKKETELLSTKVQMEIQMELGQLSPEEAEAQYQELYEQKMQEEMEYSGLNDIEKKYKNYKTSKEQAYAKILRHLKTRLKLHHVKNEGFFDATITGKEFVHIGVANGEPYIEIVNPLGVTEHRSAEQQFIHKGDYVIYKKRISIGDVLDLYGDELKKSDVTGLENRLSLIQGVDAKMASKTGESSSHWDDVNFRPNLINSIKNFTNARSGGYGNSNSNEDLIDVYICYWKSWRRIGFWKHVDIETGEFVTEKVTEDFVVPKDSMTRKIEVNGIKITEIYWLEDGLEQSIIWRYIPETWEGIRLQEDIYVRIRPYPYSFFSENNPFDHNLPILGMVTNTRNAPIVSYMDRMKPWMRLYLIVMAKWVKLIAQDKGVVQLINELMLDPKVGIEKAMAYAQELGYIGVNPLAHAEGGSTVVGMLQNMKPSEAVNLSNADKLVKYIEILQYIEQEIGDAAGISKPREGQTTHGSNVSDNQQDIVQSATISEPIFAIHDLLWEDVLNGLVKTVEVMIRKGEYESFKRMVLSDDEVASIEITPDLGEADMLVSIANNGLSYQVLEAARNQAQALLQNDRIDLEGLVTLLEAEDLQEFKVQIREIQANIDARQASMEQAQREHEEKLLQKELDAREDEQAHELELTILKLDNDLERDKVKAIASMSFGSGDGDMNNNNIPDPLEIEKLRADVEDRKAKNELKSKELQEKRRQNKVNEANKKEELKIKKMAAKNKPKPPKKKK